VLAGGLGRSLATWLVERGARYLTLLSRSAGISEQSKSLVKELESMGCSVEAVAGDVSNMQDVNRALLISERPIKGVLQLAMVLAVCWLFHQSPTFFSLTCLPG
jgi:NAD(P)-dependent dehydrogenase (short-subunit alcohol dehydrogenase family)